MGDYFRHRPLVTSFGDDSCTLEVIALWGRIKSAGTTKHSRDTRLNLAEVGQVAPKKKHTADDIRKVIFLLCLVLKSVTFVHFKCVP